MIAHLKEVDGKRIIQTIEEHCRNVGSKAKKMLEGTGLENTVYLAGLLHDMGKYRVAFADYLEACNSKEESEKPKKGKINHSYAALVYIAEKYNVGKERSIKTLTAELICFAMGSHHGMFDCMNLDGNLGIEYRLNYDKAEIGYDEAVRNFLENCANESEIDDLFDKAVVEIEIISEKIRNIYRDKTKKAGSCCKFSWSMVARLLLSAIMMADYADTDLFMNRNIKNDDEKGVEVNFDEFRIDWEVQTQYFENKLQMFSEIITMDHNLKQVTINKIRARLSQSCKDSAVGQLIRREIKGIYRLNMPTGSGKTLSSMRYAIEVAKQFKKKRILFVIPLLSILDQNAQVIRDNLLNSEKFILEHHSNVLDSEVMNEFGKQNELGMISWLEPVIITTAYQFLMTLFSGKGASIRRFQALNDCVIVIDEAQTIPTNQIAMFNLAMNFLSNVCNATIVLSTATQPDYSNTDYPIIFSNNADLVSLTDAERRVFERVEVVDIRKTEGYTIEELAVFIQDKMLEVNSLLTICNTKKEANQLYHALSICGEEYELFHLSTSMYKAHRKQVLSNMRECLEASNDKIIDMRDRPKMVCIATNLIEAGVDISCECVVRVIAGLDSINQAAGRCNRNGEYDGTKSLYIVNLRKENIERLEELKNGQKAMFSVFDRFEKLNIGDEEQINYYFNAFMREYSNSSDMQYPLKHLGCTLFSLMVEVSERNSRKEFYCFRTALDTAGREYKVFNSNTREIIVPCDENARDLIADLCSEKCKYDFGYRKTIVKRLQDYTLQIFEYQFQQLCDCNCIVAYGDFYVLDASCYNMHTGLEMEQTLY